MRKYLLIYQLLLLGLFALGLPSDAAAQPEPGYQIAQAIELSQKAGECDCTIEVLEDDRITDTIRKDMKDTGNVIAEDDESRKLYEAFDAVPMRNAVIRVVDRDGAVLDRRVFDVPIAVLDDRGWKACSPGGPAHELLVDHTRGELYFSGPDWYYFNISNHIFIFVSYIDDGDGKKYDLITKFNARQSYSIVRRRDNKGCDFLLVRSDFSLTDPATGQGDSTITFTRIHFIHGAWHARSRTEPGSWEAGEEPPSIGKYPKF